MAQTKTGVQRSRWATSAGLVAVALALGMSVSSARAQTIRQIGHQAEASPAGESPPAVEAPPAGEVPPVDVRVRELELRLEQQQRNYEALLERLGASPPTSGVAPELMSPDSEHRVEPDAAEFQQTRPPARRKKEDPLAMPGRWNHGLEFESKDKRFRVHVGGRTQFDMIWLDTDGDSLQGSFPGHPFGHPLRGREDSDAFNFRRGRLRVDGLMFGNIEWAAEYDFVNDINHNNGLAALAAAGFPNETFGNVVAVPSVTDLWMTFKDVPIVGNVRVGNMKEPIGMEHLTSSRFLPFLERSFNQDAYYGPFNNGFAPGVMAFNTAHDEHMTWAVGLFKNNSNIFGWGWGDGEYAGTGRITVLPVYEDDGRILIHLGASGSVRDPNEDLVRIRTRGSLRNGPPGPLNPFYADSSLLAATSQALGGLEFAMNWDCLTVEAEYTGSWVDDPAIVITPDVFNSPQGDVYYSRGYYVQALCFLTGEHMPYDRKQGVFTRVIPRRNWKCRTDPCDPCDRKGCGAWQVGVRYSNLNLRDTGIDGGLIQDLTIGLNWYLNPNMKVQANYVVAHRDAQQVVAANRIFTGIEGGVIEGFGMRFACDF